MNSVQRSIRKQALVPAPRDQIWQAWSTAQGATTFFAPRASVDLAIGGRYEMLFDLDAPPGSQGSEGCKILSYLPQEMLSFSWNAPPKFPTLRLQRTWLVLQFEPREGDGTEVRVTHLGWQEGDEWDQVYDYFTQAWDIVLKRLVHRFTVGPVDWQDPPR